MVSKERKCGICGTNKGIDAYWILICEFGDSQTWGDKDFCNPCFNDNFNDLGRPKRYYHYNNITII